MTPVEALKFLDAISGRIPATRDEHILIATALRALLQAISPTSEKDLPLVEG